MERTWQNPYYTTPDNSLPPSRRLSDGRAGELINRPRWSSVWGQDSSVRGDPPPPPSWLSRLDQSSQVIDIIRIFSSTSFIFSFIYRYIYKTTFLLLGISN